LPKKYIAEDGLNYIQSQASMLDYKRLFRLYQSDNTLILQIYKLLQQILTH